MGQDRAINVLLNKYAESHRNGLNEWIHVVCVPVIMWTVLGLIWALHPVLAMVAVSLSLGYYFWLSPAFALGMTLMATAMLGILYLMPTSSVLPVSAGLFVIAWIGQFIGHKIEGKKPSFFEDVRFLLIGPLFVLGFLYRRLNISY